MGRRIFIAVAEVSGDHHAAQLIRELLQLEPTLVIDGIGGPAMAAAGATIYRNTVVKAAMGWRGLLRAGEVYRLLQQTRRRFEHEKPGLLIGVDSPSMNIHFQRLAHGLGIPTLQYVAPQLWAWAIWRMKNYRRWVDHVACILPFEEAFFGEHGVRATFVGHPLFDELPPRDPAATRPRFPDRPPVIGLLGGSRKSEARANFPLMLESAARLAAAFPDATFLAPTTAATHPIVIAAVRALSQTDPYLAGRIAVGLGEFDQNVQRCDLCITVSGTATLHVAAFNVPMIVVYHVGRAIWNLVGRWLVPTRTFALVNVLAGRSPAALFSKGGHIVPEFIPWNGGPGVSDYAIAMLRDPARLRMQRDDLAALIHTLDCPGASRRAAEIALQLLNATPGAICA